MKKNSIHKILIISGIMLLLLSLLTGCAGKKDGQPNSPASQENNAQYPLEILDDAGRTITIAKKPERIISLAPSHTEILYGLGLGENIIGVTQYCDYPEDALKKPKVGDSFTVNVEQVLELQPDLVIQYWGMDEGLKNQLEEAGITLLTLSPESMAQVEETIMKIGTATGKEKEAKEMLEEMAKKKKEILDKISSNLHSTTKKKVFYEIEYSSALWTAGKGSFIDELITLSGGENVAFDAEGAYAQYSVEALLEKDPEVYVTNTFNMNVKGVQDVHQRPGFDKIKAVKDNRIEILDGNILSRPSQRVVEALELMAKAIHPELF